MIGGGLLGLEAARGLQVQGCKVTVVHLMATLMERQLDKDGGQHLVKTMEGAGHSGAARPQHEGDPRQEARRARRVCRRRRRGRESGRRRGRHPSERRARAQGRTHGEARHRRQRRHGDVRPRHLRGRGVRRASRDLLRPDRAALRAGQGAGGDDDGPSRRRVHAARCRRRSSRSWASTCSPPATGV